MFDTLKNIAWGADRMYPDWLSRVVPFRRRKPV